MKKLTKNQLKERLQVLKEVLDLFNKEKYHNISFINIESFYSHLDQYNHFEYSVKEIIESIDSYIPLKSLAQRELMELLEAGLSSNNLDELNYFKTIFYKKSVLKFLYLISEANTSKKWEEILIACENMRKTI